VLAEIDKGTYTRPSSLKFEQFSKEWLAGRRQIRGSTESGYGSLITSQLIPRLGSLTVSHIRFGCGYFRTTAKYPEIQQVRIVWPFSTIA